MSATIPTCDPLAGPIRPEQRRALFAAARRRGFDPAQLRALTPAGSVSALTRRQASDLLDSLNRGTEFAHPRRAKRGPRRAPGIYAIATRGQFAKIESLRIDLGWTPEHLVNFLHARRFAHGGAMSSVLSTADGRDVIQLLTIVLKRSRAAGKPPTGDDAARAAQSQLT